MRVRVRVRVRAQRVPVYLCGPPYTWSHIVALAHTMDSLSPPVVLFDSRVAFVCVCACVRVALICVYATCCYLMLWPLGKGYRHESVARV